ncbi:hypothetical protein NP493_2g00024 [Ridgeia piscesae]|uniref:Fukutin n=1 Tax=Ridgeia piscesae TaxID=27915 RepID=A0AAD9PFZ9_RIDPI|nr:hypothetical protein NP493_2g00024 [Ridgeia piscesae]
MRLRKVHVLAGVAIAVLLFLLVQLRLGAIARDVHADRDTDHVKSRHLSGQTVYGNIRQFTELMNENSILVFLIDPQVLHHFTTNITLLPWRCRSACPATKVTAFGVLGQLWKPKGSQLTKLHANGFHIGYFTENDPTVLAVNNTSKPPLIPTHYVFERDGHMIQLVVFYERGSGSYWWHGKIGEPQEMHGDKEAMVSPTELPFGQQAGAYDRIATIKLTINGLRLRIPRNTQQTLQQIVQSRFIECDYARARSFYTKHGLPSNENADNFVESAKKLLSHAKHTLDKLGIRFWLSSGTCLGWFRQCAIIPHSKDVDIGIWIKDYDIRLIPAMQTEGIPIRQQFGKVSDSFELSFQGGDTKLDVFFFYEEESYMWNGGTQARTGKKFKYLFPKFHVCWTEFLSMKVRVPCETQSYIEANYGTNWFEPVTTWDWKKSPPNVRENGQWSKDEWTDVIKLY